MDPQLGQEITIPKDTNCLPLTWQLENAGEDWENEWERLISNHPGLSIGWTKNELVKTRDILEAKIMILDGYLRLMPSSVDSINVKATVSEVKIRLQRIDEHIAAGRLPKLKDSTKQQLIKAAEDHERRTYGRLISEPVQSRKKDDSKKYLFDDM